MSLPINQQPQPSILELLEGWRSAIEQMKSAFDATGLRGLCQMQTISASELAKLQQLDAALASFKNDVEGCIGMTEA